MKKKYILALTFLCLLMGHSSYAQDWQDMDLDAQTTAILQQFENAGVQITAFTSTEAYIYSVNNDTSPNNNFTDQNGDGTVNTTDMGVVIAISEAELNAALASTTQLREVVIVNDYHNPIPIPILYYHNSNDIYVYYPEGGGSGGTNNPPPPPIWYLDYDGDGYYSETYQSDYSPGVYWKGWTYGYDCDDTRPQYTTECCTTTCESGYKLNSDTCECELLPPCWGTTVEGLMPDGSGDQSQLVKALEAMVNSFFKSSDLLETMKMIGILDSAELSKGFKNYIDGGDILGKISIGFVANDYNNNPTTENFMKIFVEGALLFLPPPASIGYTSLDTLYQKYFDGKPFSEVLAKKMAEFSAELFDCDLGSGVYGLIH